MRHAAFTLWTKRPNLARMEATFQGMSLVQAFDGETAWWINPLVGARGPQVMPADFKRSLERWVDFDGPLVGYKDKGNKVEYLGQETTYVGDKLYKIKLVLADGDVWHVFIDADSYLEVRRTYEQIIEGAAKEASFLFSNFMTVDGVTVPGKIVGQGPDGTPYTMTFDAYDFNAAVDADMFAMPEADATTPSTTIVELTDIDPLKKQFNGDAGAVRSVILLSPN